jgi:hypothetical protein
MAKLDVKSENKEMGISPRIIDHQQAADLERKLQTNAARQKIQPRKI